MPAYADCDAFPYYVAKMRFATKTAPLLKNNLAICADYGQIIDTIGPTGYNDARLFGSDLKAEVAVGKEETVPGSLEWRWQAFIPWEMVLWITTPPSPAGVGTVPPRS